MELRQYQQEAHDESLAMFLDKRKILLQLATGAGKTVVFSFIAKNFTDQNKKVLILVHRIELVNQTVETLSKIGITGIETITAKSRSISPFANVYVAMVETMYNRINKGKFAGIDIDLIINDECHRLDFQKVIAKFPKEKILGVTATPVLQKNETFFRCRRCGSENFTGGECCGYEMDEWTRPITMSKYYEDIVIGIGIKELIDMGALCPDLNFIETPENIDQLKSSSQNEDGFSSKSIEEVFNDSNTMFNVLQHYEDHCRGKKTLIFNSNVKGNKMLYEKFIEAGYNARMFDSVHSSAKERASVVAWFENNRDAVLLNVGCFTTGFDVKDVECIILNKATKSLSLFLQMVGRGGRITDKIFKDKFIVIDGGGNIERHQRWSTERDWRALFFGTGNKKEKLKKEDILDTVTCTECGSIVERTALVCFECGKELIKKKKQDSEITRDTKLEAIDKIPLPSAEAIYRYTVSKCENVNFAYKVMINQILDLMRCYCVSSDDWVKIRDKRGGRLDTIIKSIYFPLMKHKDIQTSTGRKLDTLIEMCVKKIDNYYNI